MESYNYELEELTTDLRGMHEDFLPHLHAALAHWGDEQREETERHRTVEQLLATRRNFLKGGLVSAGALGGGVVLAACGSTSTTTGAASPTPGPDLQVARLAAGLEVLAINTYTGVLTAAGQGHLGAVPPSIAQFITTTKKQHNDHLGAWNGALQQNGVAAVTNPDAALSTQVNQQAQAAIASGLIEVLKLALKLETIAVETYVQGAGGLTTATNRELTMTIAPVEAQHVAILNFVLGNYPVPDTTIKTDLARSLSDLTATAGATPTATVSNQNSNVFSNVSNGLSQ